MEQNAKRSSPEPGSADTRHMNHMGVTHFCGRCQRPSVVIIAGAHYCSSHGLDMTLHRLTVPSVVDLRLPEPAWAHPVQALAS